MKTLPRPRPAFLGQRWQALKNYEQSLQHYDQALVDYRARVQEANEAAQEAYSAVQDMDGGTWRRVPREGEGHFGLVRDAQALTRDAEVVAEDMERVWTYRGYTTIEKRKPTRYPYLTASAVLLGLWVLAFVLYFVFGIPL